MSARTASPRSERRRPKFVENCEVCGRPGGALGIEFAAYSVPKVFPADDGIRWVHPGCSAELYRRVRKWLADHPESTT